MTRRALAALLVLASVGGLAAQQRPPVFRTATDLVTIDVAVRSRNVAVAGLAAEHFEVTDNGVRQQIEMIDAASLPVDLTVVLDISGSMLTLVGPMTKYANSLLEFLQADDRLRLITVGTYIARRFDFSRATEQLEVEEINPGEMTSLYDGIAAALMRSRQPDRRHVIVVLSDGIDTTSTLELKAVESIVRRTDAVFYYVLPEDPGTGKFPDLPLRANTRNRWMMPRFNVMPDGGIDTVSVADLARLTGGGFEHVLATPGGLPAIVKDVLEKFRYSYVLRYRATGVKREGWHEVTVTLPRHPGVEIRARKGYFGG
jgi:VWFA-related protein